MDLKAFSRSRTYSQTAVPGDIVQDMHALRRFDRHHERKQSLWSWLFGIGLVATVVLGFGGIMAVESGGKALMPFAGVALIFALISFGIRRRYKRFNLENRRYELVARLLRYLSADMAPGEQVGMAIDFRETDHRDKFAGKGESNGWKIQHYKDSWLQVQGRFVDGTRFVIQLAQLLQKRSKWKRGASGKMKHKTKQKGKALAMVRLSVKPDKYPRLPQVAGGAQQAVQLPGHAALGDLGIEGHRLTIKSTFLDRWSEEEEHSGSQVIAMMLLSLYQVLNLAKDIDKKEQAA